MSYSAEDASPNNPFCKNKSSNDPSVPSILRHLQANASTMDIRGAPRNSGNSKITRFADLVLLECQYWERQIPNTSSLDEEVLIVIFGEYFASDDSLPSCESSLR
jgi:hypothetical protein